MISEKNAPSLARRIRGNLALPWRRFRNRWREETYPAWMMFIPNPLPPERPTRKTRILLWRRARHTLCDENHPA